MKFGIKDGRLIGKIVTIMFVLGLFLGVVPAAYGQVATNVKVVLSDQGKALNMSARIVSNSLMVPYQDLVGNLGGQISWDSKARKVTITKDGTVLAWPQAKIKASLKGIVDVNQCLLRLTESEIEQFQEKQIVSIRLSTQERSFTLAQSQRAQDIINCVIYAQYCDIKSDKLVNHL
jgi:hypothetical protein